MMRAAIREIAYYLPEGVVTNADLETDFPEWSMDKIESKTGICSRHIAAPGECSSDLAVQAAQRLFASGACDPTGIDYLLLCTQSPDYFLPTTACTLQQRLGMRTSAGALDFNLGCSGYVYGLGLAQGLIVSGQAERVLLVTAETYSKFIHNRDKSVRTLFGDAAAATLLAAVPEAEGSIPAPFVFGTDGRGAGNLIVPAGAFRKPPGPDTGRETSDEQGNVRSEEQLYMNGAEIFTFTLREIPDCVNRLLQKAKLTVADVDLFVFHQANQYMLEHLRKKMRLPAEKFCVFLRDCGNTVSSTIPIALKEARQSGQLQDGQRVMLVGFGVGYSWGATLLRWPNLELLASA
ncbi:MAG: ketoacyl-ACP synthase III [Bryobacterales bacterium]|nr:ketoacyl-ACP synthase III [Bryobacterales bacterium]